MTLTLEIMDWIKLFLILSAIIGNAVWIKYTVKDLKEGYKSLEGNIKKMESRLETRITEVEKELRYELHEKMDKKDYYDDISGWRTDIRELRKIIIEILQKGERK